jgi:transcription initiation factor TFIIIB Brf1 subunit/transcription initiation factor TFIIB
MEPNSTEESMDVTSSTTPPTKVDSRRVEIQAKFEEICQSLNLDEQAKTCAWDAYVDLSDKYGLEEQNRPTHWLACALYVACRTTKVETVSGEETMGSNVPLTRILKEADIRYVLDV